MIQWWMWDLWILQNPTSELTKNSQCFNVHQQKWLLQLQIDEVQKHATPSSSRTLFQGDFIFILIKMIKNVNQAPHYPRAAELRLKIIIKLDTWNLCCNITRLSHSTVRNSARNVHAAILTILTNYFCISNSGHRDAWWHKRHKLWIIKEQGPWWRGRLETKAI